jgi:hypothetical protein
MARVLLRRLGSVSGAASIDYATADGTARVSWAAGDAGHRWIEVQTLDDNATEQPEFFTLGFSSASGASRIGPPQLRIAIHDMDGILVDDLESLCHDAEAEAAFGAQ